MRITRVQAWNWRNFKTIDVPVEHRLFVVGPNAAGKSNLLDIFRFLADVARPDGGLASALEHRGGLPLVKSLFARNNNHGELTIEVALKDDEDHWTYRLSIKQERAGRHRVVVAAEVVTKNGVNLLNRPDDLDLDDPARLTQTHLEQIAANQKFRPIADYFAKVHYFHPVPQVIRNPTGGPFSDEKFYGGNLIAEMNKTTPRYQQAWLRRLQGALAQAVPGFESLDVVVDSSGRPHLKAGYRNWRANPALQSEQELSDGTLRLIGLLWTIVSMPSSGGILLLEEPELSLNSAIVRSLAPMFAVARRSKQVQIVLSSHSPELLDDEGVDAAEVLVLRVTKEGTIATLLSEIDDVADELAAGLPKSELVNGLIAPDHLDQLMAAMRS